MSKKVFALLVVSVGVGIVLGSAPAKAQNVDIANPGNVVVIDTATNTVTGSIKIRRHTDGVAVSPDGSTVYVTDTVFGFVSVVDAATNAITAAVHVGHGPTGVAVTPDGSTIYVADSIRGGVSVMDTANNTVIAEIRVGEHHQPRGVAVTPDGSTIYVTRKGL